MNGDELEIYCAPLMVVSEFHINKSSPINELREHLNTIHTESK